MVRKTHVATHFTTEKEAPLRAFKVLQRKKC